MAKQNPVSIQQKIGARIRELRNKAKYSQENLGHFSDLDRTYINSIERGLKSPTINTVVRLCDTLEITPEKAD